MGEAKNINFTCLNYDSAGFAPELTRDSGRDLAP